MNKPTVGAVLIVKNEEAVLEDCLKSIQGLDEIIVLDTGSTDNTCEIARKYTDKVYEGVYTWNDNFAEARNKAKGYCTTDWILSIDADETLCSQGIPLIRDAITRGKLAVNVVMFGRGDSFMFPRLFKNDPKVFWKGAIHNHLSVVGEFDEPIRIKFGYSPAHTLDPDRAFRILKRVISDGTGGARELFYLGREYLYRKEYETAIQTYQNYLKVAHFGAEMADANLAIARCYNYLGNWNTAKDYCLQAIKINSNYKEAIEFLASLSGPGNKQRWLEFAATATNQGVLFTNSPSTNDTRSFKKIIVNGQDLWIDNTLKGNDILSKSLLYNGRFYEEGMLNFIRDIPLDKDKAIVDVGANVGNHTLFFSLFCPCSEIFAFEPYEKVRTVLENHIKMNNLKNVTVIPHAVGDKEGICGLNRSPNNCDGQTCVIDGKDTKLVTLDKSLQNTRISLIKLDVEGYEYNVLLGAKKLLKTQHPYLFIEIKEPEIKQKIDDYLSTFGYTSVSVFNATPTYLYSYFPDAKTVPNRDELLKILPKKCRLAELGVFIGDYSKKIISIVEPSEFYMVDIFEAKKANSSGVSVDDLSSYYKILIDKYKTNKKIHVVKNTTSEFLRTIDSLDAVYIDADHSYASVQQDLNNSHLKVKEGGYILGHDYQKPDVRRAVLEFCVKNNLFIEYLTDEEAPSFAIYNTQTKMEKIVYYSEGMKIFGENMLKYMDYRRYNDADINKPVFFQGLYFDQDYETFRQHRGKKTLFWNNSDVPRMRNNAKWLSIVKSFPDTIHLCHNEQLRAELESLGITSTIKPIFFGDVNKYSLSYKQSDSPHVYLIAHPGREQEYGVTLVHEIADEVPEVTFHIYGLDGVNTKNIIYHGNVDASIAEARLDSEIKNYHCCLRANLHDGVSQTVMKCIMMGQYPITFLEMEGVWHAKNNEDVIKYLRLLKDQKEPNKVREKYIEKFMF